MAHASFGRPVPRVLVRFQDARSLTWGKSAAGGCALRPPPPFPPHTVLTFVQPDTSWPVRANAGIYTKAAVAPRPSRGEGGFRGEFLGRTSAQHRVWRKWVVAGAGGALAHPPAADFPHVRLRASWNRTSKSGESPQSLPSGQASR
jgi:hypothetical protein